MELQRTNLVDKKPNTRDIARRPIRKLLATAVLGISLVAAPTSASALLGGPSNRVEIISAADPGVSYIPVIVIPAPKETKTWWDEAKAFLKEVSNRITALGKTSQKTSQNSGIDMGGDKFSFSDRNGNHILKTDGTNAWQEGQYSSDGSCSRQHRYGYHNGQYNDESARFIIGGGNGMRMVD